ncbi:MAG: tRNA pseudouridine(55) synthase TruB [Candidatus Omnitrophica bacterium]|nr:tRNA pseudouridine(55) synthase TruB [Candidatus Omnitrophota bacterium]
MIDNIFGILVIDKPKDMTSHDVVSWVRRKFAIDKVGHAGTLDPNATGVLVLLLGKATKMSDTFMNSDKEYLAVMELGKTTDSCDACGKVTAEKGIKDLDLDETKISETVKRFTGVIDQLPPMFSAIKIGGEKLYNLARKGIEIEREPKKVNIKEIEVTKIELPIVEFRVLCGKGTYIRQLVYDIGEKLSSGAYLKELRRTRSGDFTVEKSVTLEALEKMTRESVLTLGRSWQFLRSV